MLAKLIEQKNTHVDQLSKQFDRWLFEDRGRQVRGIEYFLNKRSEITDQLIISASSEVGINKINDFGIFAVGGYGRNELHPFSDIDLLLLSESELSSANEKKIQLFISLLWDLGMEVGHSVRTVKQSKDQARKDIYTMTNMLEFRKLIGQESIHESFIKILNTKNLWRNKSFVKAKIEEQLDRHNKFNNTSYNLEPDIKSSPGGLRDIHTIDWLIKNLNRGKIGSEKISMPITFEERKELNKSKYWLWMIRYLLHLEANREEDRLLFEHQINIAKKLFPTVENSNQAAEKLMHRYYRSSFTISEINSTLIQSFKEKIGLTKSTKKSRIDKNFYSQNNLIHLYDVNGFKKDSSLLLELFIKLSENPTLEGIGSATLRALKRDRDLIDTEFRSNRTNINLFLKITPI